MTYKTHFVGGICATAIASTVVPMEDIAIVAAVSAFSALLPDIDIEGSKVNNKAGLIGKGISSAFNHRGFIHTPILYIVLYYLTTLILPANICLGFLIGTISHLVIDSFNYTGIMWLYPFTKKHYHIASIKTRSVGETIFLIAMVVVSAFVLANNVGITLIDANTPVVAKVLNLFDFSILDSKIRALEIPQFDFSKFNLSNFKIDLPEFEIPSYNWENNSLFMKCKSIIQSDFCM